MQLQNHGLKHVAAFDVGDERLAPSEDEHLAIFACPCCASARGEFLLVTAIAFTLPEISQRSSCRIPV